MKKEHVNEKLKNIVLQIVLICVLVVLFVLSLIFYNKLNQNRYVCFNESSNISYDVKLKDNPFLDETKIISSEQEYLDTLIEKINSTFNYSLKLDQEDLNLEYVYYIDANIEVKNRNSSKYLYRYSEYLLNETEKKAVNEGINISEATVIDYNRYNSKIKEFVNAYGLDSADALLTVSLHVVLLDNNCQLVECNQDESIVSLEIPLTEKTVNIDIVDNLVNSSTRFQLCEENRILKNVLLVFTVIDVLALVIAVYRFIALNIASKSAQEKYRRELGRIVSNYASYIQEIEEEIDISRYESWKIKNFEDLIEISERINQPILKVENIELMYTNFVVPVSDSRIYVYRIEVEE